MNPTLTTPSRLLALVLLLSAAALGPRQSAAQSTPALRLSGEVRPRFFSREPVDGEWDQWISSRTRFGIEALFPEDIGLFVQIQDVRLWGEEKSERDIDGDNVDFHQAYLEVNRVPGLGGLLRAGRQEVALAESRFISAPDWGQGGQSFDGLRWVRSLEGRMEGGALEVVYLRLGDASAPGKESDESFWASWFRLPGFGIGAVDLLLIHNRQSASPGEPDDPGRTRQTTAGGLWKTEAGPLDLRLHGMLQLGTRSETDVLGSFLAASARLAILDGAGQVTLWYDRLSGDDDSGDETIRSFSTLFGARHAYYGRADYFTDVPGNTEDRGLQDLAVKLAYLPLPGLRLNADLHAFSTTVRRGLSTRRLAQELDFWARYRVREVLALEAGFTFTRAEAAMVELGLLEEDGSTVYLMTSVRF